MAEKTPFSSEKVITQHISEADLKTYFVGFDLDDGGQKVYRWKNLTNILQEVLPEFVFGSHQGTETANTALYCENLMFLIYIFFSLGGFSVLFLWSWVVLSFV